MPKRKERLGSRKSDTLSIYLAQNHLFYAFSKACFSRIFPVTTSKNEKLLRDARDYSFSILWVKLSSVREARGFLENFGFVLALLPEEGAARRRREEDGTCGSRFRMAWCRPHAAGG
ncbi:MAG: hypothetical protein FWG93_03505, partial [Oscillospiraceae bacterium]|nr:hypothetical protein [Oscillospiraceae bacterium]